MLDPDSTTEPLHLERPLTARSVLATALLGSANGALSVAQLCQAGALFDIADSAVRTCLSRMVAAGELTASDGVYELAGGLAQRRHDIDGAIRPQQRDPCWDGTWEIVVARAGPRSAAQRHAVRTAAGRLGLGVLRDGCWTRPNNLARGRRTADRSTIERWCLTFVSARTDHGQPDCEELFGLPEWAGAARDLCQSIATETTRTLNDAADRRRQFLLAIASARHLRADPMLPEELLPGDWPGHELRRSYGELTSQLRRTMIDAER